MAGMCYAMNKGMNMSIIAFIVMASATILFMAATLAGEWQPRLPKLTQTGDSSLGPQSVNWLAAIAFAAAIYVIYLVEL